MRTKLSTILSAAAASLTFGLAWGCGGGAHLSDDFGQRSRAAFRAQQVEPQPKAEDQAPAGLDSEEASIIHGQYRKSMGATGRTAPQGEPRVLVVEEPKK